VPPRSPTDLARQRAGVDAFLAAARGGDFDALLAVLDPDVVLRADVGAVPAGASRVIRGAPAVAEQALAFARRLGPFARPALVNGAAGIVAAPGGRPASILGFTVTRGKIVEIDILADPERLSGSTLRSSRRNEVERRGSRPKEERWQRLWSTSRYRVVSRTSSRMRERKRRLPPVAEKIGHDGRTRNYDGRPPLPLDAPRPTEQTTRSIWPAACMCRAGGAPIDPPVLSPVLGRRS